MLPIIAITIGDPAGVGPELALKACVDPAVIACCRPLLIGSRNLLRRVAERMQLEVPKRLVDVAAPSFDAGAVEAGKVSAMCGAAALAFVDEGIRGCMAGDHRGMVTCPINKAALHAAGCPFPGHTEILGDRCGVIGEVMLMYHRKLAVALVTSHQSLASVPGAIEPLRIVRVGKLLAEALRRLRGRPPRLAVCGLNPHAGEDGLFGDEDQRRIVPAIAELRQLGIDVEGPLPADTAFTPQNRKRFDGYVCMYHDQGLVPFKALHFDEGVNVTLGLPIIRTSVDHGTAFDIAWQGRAHHRSLVAAIQLAAQLATD